MNEVLLRAKQLILDKGWWKLGKGVMHRPSGAQGSPHCALTAINNVAPRLMLAGLSFTSLENIEAVDKLYTAIGGPDLDPSLNTEHRRDAQATFIIDWNDDKASYEELLAAFDKAAAA